jgi:hypothetical protein
MWASVAACGATFNGIAGNRPELACEPLSKKD